MPSFCNVRNKNHMLYRAIVQSPRLRRTSLTFRIAISTSPGKRKASDFVDTDDSENIDPSLFSKRTKSGENNYCSSKDSFVKPSSFFLTKSATTGSISLNSTPKAASTPRSRSHLNPKSSAAKINTSIAKSSPLSAPAGRSPTRGKRSGLLSSRRRTSGHYRVDPPAFGLPSKSSAPFSLDAALKGTIPGYKGRNASLTATSSVANSTKDLRSIFDPELSSLDFQIHEDTPEQEMTNLLQHSTCVLDISSDEETETRRERERAEGKENVPPADDISQTSRPRANRPSADDMIVEKERSPLSEMDVREYYSEGHDETSVVIVPGDEEGPDDRQQPAQKQQTPHEEVTSDPQPTAKPAVPKLVSEEKTKPVEELMQKTSEPAPCAAVLEPVEGTGESFEVWESGSIKEEIETPAADAVTVTVVECS